MDTDMPKIKMPGYCTT